MANFDNLASQDTFKCEIKPPFRMSDRGITNKNDPELPQFVASLNQQYKKWVSVLLAEQKGFEYEITQLQKQIIDIKSQDDLVVFTAAQPYDCGRALKRIFPSQYPKFGIWRCFYQFTFPAF